MKPDFTLKHLLDGYRSLSNPYLAERYLDQFIRDYVFDDHGAYYKEQDVQRFAPCASRGREAS